MTTKVLLANPRGFCAGVDRAIEIVERTLEQFGAPVYVRHEVVHNRYVVEDLRARGAVFVESLDEVPDDARVIFSAHGVPRSVQDAAAGRGLQVFDATCPLVTKVHLEVMRHARAGQEVVLIGHAGHPEVEGTMGQYASEALRHGGSAEDIHLVETAADIAALQIRDPASLSFVTQTTLSLDDTRALVEALQQRFPTVEGPRRDDICYATQNRQNAVRELSAQTECVLVVGSANSSNSNRLREVAERNGVPAYLVDDASAIDPQWIAGKQTIGVSAGASAPEVLVQGVIARLQELGMEQVEELAGVREDVVFPVPRLLRA
jgi:4-hydroxy-3-methylbut-2-enyl diphosphate reductase